MRQMLASIARENKLISKKERKMGADSEPKEAKQPLLPMLRQGAQIVPCLGGLSGVRPGCSIPDCIFLNFEDFNKLVVYESGFVSSFIDDLVQYLTVGLLSASSIEMYLGHLRDEPDAIDFSTVTRAQTVQEFLVQKKIEQLKRPWLTTEPEVPLELVSRKEVNKGVFDFNAQFHNITQPYSIQDQELALGSTFAGKILLQKDKERSEKAQEGEPTQLDTETNGSANPKLDEPKAALSKLVLIGESKIKKLVAYRELFGAPSFFKIFRAFYKLSHITPDTQNNPFALYMDRASCLRGFAEVFDIEVEEIAVRFFRVFTVSEAELMSRTSYNYCFAQDKKHYPARKHHIGLMRWLKTIKFLIDVDSDDHRQMHLRLLFAFYDYDGNGSIGSVDIVNLAKGDQATLVPKKKST